MALAQETLILAINAGSSSIKFSLYKGSDALEPVFKGGISDIGGRSSAFAVAGNTVDAFERRFPIPEHITATNVLVEWLRGRLPAGALDAIVYRVVYGGAKYAATVAIDGDVLAALYGASSGEHGHLPQELHLIDVLRRSYPGAAHIACFDSAFHASIPLVASTLPIPRRYYGLGIRRYGYHGISCAYVVNKLAQVAGPGAGSGKLVIAHLGGGASVTAVEHGQSCDTSMGLTPAGGIMMGKRAGDLDPGLARQLVRLEQMSQSGFDHMVNHESGLLGVSETSADIGVLLSHQAGDSRAAQAVEMFCYQVRKAICTMAGAIDGVDTLVFAGGIGERCAEVRERVCKRLSHLGIVLDPVLNAAGAPVISSTASKVCVRVIETDEQWMMASEAQGLLAAGIGLPRGSQHA